MSTQLSDYDYDLPEELIASSPLEKRSSSRLLVLDRKTNTISHKHFSDILDFLTVGDALFVNNTKVIPARIKAKRDTGREIEVLLLREIALGEWEALVSHSGKVKQGESLVVGEDFRVTVYEETKTPGVRRVEFSEKENFWNCLNLYGKIPLPPYIKREASSKDQDTYQTVYAAERGAVAAPTAGLHFDETLLEKIKEKGIRVGEVTLHVGYGTFQPLKENHFETQSLHEEHFEISEEAAQIYNDVKQKGNKVFVCGTTTLRALESVQKKHGRIQAEKGSTSIFIYPPYSVTTADALITNFHLPQTSLLCLISAFADREQILNSYQTAIQEKYRFFSYGDAMLII